MKIFPEEVRTFNPIHIVIESKEEYARWMTMTKEAIEYGVDESELALEILEKLQQHV